MPPRRSRPRMSRRVICPGSNDRFGQGAQRSGVRHALVWSVSVVEVFELSRGVEQAAAVPDQQAVQKLATAGLHPAFHERVHARHRSPTPWKRPPQSPASTVRHATPTSFSRWLIGSSRSIANAFVTARYVNRSSTTDHHAVELPLRQGTAPTDEVGAPCAPSGASHQDE